MAGDAGRTRDAWEAHRDEQRRARLALTPEERLAWLWQAKVFAAAVREAADRRRADRTPR
jgi:hypothetical protein